MSAFPLKALLLARRVPRRRSLAIAFLLAVVIGATGCLPGVLAVPTSGLSYGKGPLDAIREAADRTTTSGSSSQCGLSSLELAVMMMVPTYFEAGGPTPSPMALSRWDNLSVSSTNANLFAFGQTTGAYVNAFFSPGIGLWQFDSAGGWDLTASDAIDAGTASNAAASTIAYRWCNAPESRRATPELRRAYAWGPWFGCRTGNSTSCEDRYKQLVTEGQINSAQDSAVDRTGGMAARKCNIANIGSNLSCWYVNPTNAQGSRGWISGTYDPARPNYVTPLPKPFYVVRANGREYRIWIQADTGFDIGITASKPVTANARTSLEWTRSAPLCDVTAMRGDCSTSIPSGYLDGASAGPGTVNVWGWGFTPGNPDAAATVTIDGLAAGTVRGTIARGDVQRRFPAANPNSGFAGSFAASGGTHTVCVTMQPLPAGSFGCRTVKVPSGSPVGVLDSVTAAAGAVTVRGWAIDLDTSDATWVHIYVNNVSTGVYANNERADVGAVFPGYGPNHGFSGSFAAPAGTNNVCAWAINMGIGSHALLGCRQVTVAGGSPIGLLDSVTRSAEGIALRGWAIDLDTTAPVDMHIYVSGVNTLVPASSSRPDVGAAFPGYGDNHGFSTMVPARGASSDVCVYAINVGSGAHRLLGCRKV